MKIDHKDRNQPSNWEEFWQLFSEDKASQLILLEIQKIDILYQSANLTLELIDYTVTVDNFAVNHVLKKHGEKQKEKKKKQYPVIKDDFAFIGKVLDGDMIYDGMNRNNHKFKFTNKIGDYTYVVVMVVRIKPKYVALKTMYKK